MVAVFLGIFVVQAIRGDIDFLDIIMGASGLWFIAITIQGRVRLRNAVTAERLNLEILEGISEPYSPSWSPAQIEVPPVAFIVIAVVMLFIYGVPFGLLQLAGPEATHSAYTVIAKGAFFGVFMTIFQLTVGRDLAERRSERKADISIPSS
jgi:hypothetical protein